MRSLIIFIVLLLYYSNILAQIYIVNESRELLPNVQVFSERQIIAHSNEYGVLSEDSFSKLNSNDTLVFKHIGYNSKFLLKKNIKNNDTIVLVTKKYELDEVLIEGEKKYKIIDAFYRSRQINDDSLIYYTDGEVEYLSKFNKDKYKRKLKSHRVYIDSNYIKTIKKRNIMFVFSIARVSLPLIEFLPNKYIEKNRLYLEEVTESLLKIYTKDSNELGTIELDSAYVKYKFRDIDSNITRKAPNLESTYLCSQITFVFNKKDDMNNYLYDNFNNLVYSKIEREYKIKYKEDKKYIRVKNVEEIFVKDVLFVNKVNKDEYLYKYGLPKDSNYSNNFMNNCSNEFYKPFPIEKYLKER